MFLYIHQITEAQAETRNRSKQSRALREWYEAAASTTNTNLSKSKYLYSTSKLHRRVHKKQESNQDKYIYLYKQNI